MLQSDKPANKPVRTTARALALVCALHIWVLGIFAASPDLHALFHADAGQTDHSCAITLFSAGAENPSPTLLTVTAPALPQIAVLLPGEQLHAESPTDWLLPGRGPPIW